MIELHKTISKLGRLRKKLPEFESGYIHMYLDVEGRMHIVDRAELTSVTLLPEETSEFLRWARKIK
jgi:hypothetical protein